MAEKKTEKAKKLTLPQFRKAVRNLSEGETAELLEGLYRSSPEAADYLNLRISGEEFRKAYAEEIKAKLKDCFYNKKGLNHKSYGMAHCGHTPSCSHQTA
jgi:hypothetical protein